MWGSGSQGRPTIVTYSLENRETNGKVLWQLCTVSNIQLPKVTAYMVTEHESFTLATSFLQRRVHRVQRDTSVKRGMQERSCKKCPWMIALTIDGSVDNEYVMNPQRA